MKTLQFYAINIFILPLALYSLFITITCTVNYIALPVTLICFFILAYNNKLIQ
jgi:hypothetical protein